MYLSVYVWCSDLFFTMQANYRGIGSAALHLVLYSHKKTCMYPKNLPPPTFAFLLLHYISMDQVQLAFVYFHDGIRLVESVAHPFLSRFSSFTLSSMETCLKTKNAKDDSKDAPLLNISAVVLECKEHLSFAYCIRVSVNSDHVSYSPQPAVATAMVFFHRFYTRHSFSIYKPEVVAI